MKALKLLTLIPALAAVSCGQHRTPSHVKEAWNEANDPLILGGSFDRRLTALPVSGQLSTLPWSDTYWPSYLGGISQRWRNPPKDQFDYKSPTQDKAAAMSLTELANLSPAEKYDLLQGNYDYPTVSRERGRVSPKNETWEGICHGWSPAALNFEEPKPVQITNADGIAVPFGSSDVKALLSYFQGELSNAPSRMLGTRCDIDLAKHPNAVSTHPECKGINAGAFHVALVNLIGTEQKGFVADVSHGNQIWNQPVYGFTTTIGKKQGVSEGAAPDAVAEVVVHTEMNYAQEVDPSWEALNGTDGWGNNAAEYDYRLELNENDEIVGGAWVGSDLPDFIWTQDKPSFGSSYYSQIRSVYEKSQVGPALADPR